MFISKSLKQYTKAKENEENI